MILMGNRPVMGTIWLATAKAILHLDRQPSAALARAFLPHSMSLPARTTSKPHLICRRESRPAHHAIHLIPFLPGVSAPQTFFGYATIGQEHVLFVRFA